MPADPLHDPEPLIRRVYAYVAFRLGAGADAEDVTSEVFERAVRYRGSFDARKGTASAWLIGIARHCVDDVLKRSPPAALTDEHPDDAELEREAIQRLMLVQALGRLDSRERELIALRYIVGLSAKEVAASLGLSAGAVDVAVHRAKGRLAVEMRRVEMPSRRERQPDPVAASEA